MFLFSFSRRALAKILVLEREAPQPVGSPSEHPHSKGCLLTLRAPALQLSQPGNSLPRAKSQRGFFGSREKRPNWFCKFELPLFHHTPHPQQPERGSLLKRRTTSEGGEVKRKKNPERSSRLFAKQACCGTLGSPSCLPPSWSFFFLSFFSLSPPLEAQIFPLPVRRACSR